MDENVKESEFLERSRNELELAGFFNPEGMYGTMIGDTVLELVKVFSDQGHSGLSAAITAHVFKELVEGNHLSPITDSPEEWFNHGEGMGNHEGELWQNRRNGSLFSEDGGKTYYDVDGDRDVLHSSVPANNKGD